MLEWAVRESNPLSDHRSVFRRAVLQTGERNTTHWRSILVRTEQVAEVGIEPTPSFNGLAYEASWDCQHPLHKSSSLGN